MSKTARVTWYRHSIPCGEGTLTAHRRAGSDKVTVTFSNQWGEVSSPQIAHWNKKEWIEATSKVLEQGV